MKLFLFNDIIPNTVSQEEIINGLKKTVIEYKKLRVNYPDYIDGIISTAQLNGIKLAENFTLADCLESIDNKEIKAYSFSVFTKYPIDSEIDVESVLEEGNDFNFELDSVQRDALFIKIISKANGVLFSLNLHYDLAKDSLEINPNDKETSFRIDNLYGSAPNTDYIESVIEKEVISKVGSLEKLKRKLSNPISSLKFDREFNKMSKEVQDSIIDGFDTVINSRLSGINIPETLLKDVTPQKEKSISVKELKMRDPIAKRLYFTEIEEKFYLASLEDKPLKDRQTTEQSTHIKSALSTLKQLISLR
ncbi:hypothetical protein [Flavobacterium sp. GSP14]|uniref:hypothetical protein n=1 Tax=Flavobacterium sp. GSP14 TaxID=3401734 RepID=UPI003AAB7CBF